MPASTLYARIEETLAAEIAQGEYRPGDQLPTEDALLERFQVSRITVRRAIQNLVNRGLLELDKIQSYRHNPTVYVELVGNALFNPFVLEFAPMDTRYKGIVARLQGIPALMQQGQANLLDSPEIWNKVAREENEGNIDLIDKTLRAKVPEALKGDYERAAGPALSRGARQRARTAADVPQLGRRRQRHLSRPLRRDHRLRHRPRQCADR